MKRANEARLPSLSKRPLGFRLGEFYGSPEATCRGTIFDVRLLNATTREEDVELHAHADAHFVLVLSGVYRSSALGAPEYAPAPFLVFNPPGTTHQDRFLNGIGAFMTVSLSRASFDEAHASDRLHTAATALDGSSVLCAAFHLARSVRRQEGAAVEFAGWDLLAKTTSRSPRIRSAPRWAHVAYEALMDEAARPDLNVEDLARAAGVHPVHLARVFRAAWGQSPAQLLRWRRTERAIHLLIKTRESAAEIASAVGFVDQSHLSRTLQSLYGMTPGECRHRMLRRYNPVTSRRPRIP